MNVIFVTVVCFFHSKPTRVRIRRDEARPLSISSPPFRFGVEHGRNGVVLHQHARRRCRHAVGNEGESLLLLQRPRSSRYFDYQGSVEAPRAVPVGALGRERQGAIAAALLCRHERLWRVAAADACQGVEDQQR